MPRTARIPPQLTGVPFLGSQAIAAGLITKGMLDGPAWRRLFPNVYIHHTSTAPDHRMWCTAALLRLPHQVAVGGPSAAGLWDAATLPANAPVSIVAPRHLRLRPHHRLTVHYTTLAPSDLATHAGLRLTTPERTLFDLGRRHDRTDTLVVLDAMLHRHLLREDVLRRMIEERSAWPGTPRLSRLIALAEPGAESPMETRLRLVLHDAGLPAPVAQFEVRDVTGEFAGRVDLAWPAARLAVEYDGDHHREPQQFRDDVARLNALRMAGWTVLRCTADDVLRRPAETARMVLGALVDAGWPTFTASPPAG